ncbi:MAG: NYN domain-containing protein, partial [Dongiaceae bacterium]
MATQLRTPRLAVLIDADNTSSRIAPGLFQEIATIGEASVRRIYGDFSGTKLKSWAGVLSTHAIMPHQNFA